MYGERIVIPKKFQRKILQQLHKGHPGVERMRMNVLLSQRLTQNKAGVMAHPRKTVAEDPLDPLSKWPEVIPTKSITSAATIAILRQIFSRFGMPEVLVSGNGSQLVSDVFERFCESNGIMHLKTTPFHPQSTIKRTMKKIQAGGETLDEALNTFLLCYRSTPCRSAPGGKSPAELLLGRPLRTSFELLRPPSKFNKNNSLKQNQQFNTKHGAKEKCFDVQDQVYAQVHRGNDWNWVPGVIVERVGTVIYNVWIPQQQQLIRSHSNQLRKRYGSEVPTMSETDPSISLDILLGSWGLNPSNPSAAPEEMIPPAEPEELNEI
ncbi:uncharacterized protein K02A2.6-like [Toxorhynchites rutilus septentrionalis]|uniref:uncharacterized protein K02A2.6-like n=1 Tax=Toxorhynchites rutilus septentrionalis TaxID=329112 RepID=UPI00247A362C|nr:uncharacterized protein K02A2.6-like [Toxorhynchites rutilus septentrionalis]